jgi:hypothetical protein
MKLTSWFAVCVMGAIFATILSTARAEEPTASPAPSVGDTEEDTTKEGSSPSPDGQFAFLIGHGEYEQTIDLVDKKTEKVPDVTTDYTDPASEAGPMAKESCSSE